MNALDVFERVQAADTELMDIQDKIERRRALATRSTARPTYRNPGGGGGSGDASVRLLDYMSNVEDLEQKYIARQRMKENDLACCVYLLEILPPNLAGVMSRRYLEGKSQKVCGDELGYSVTTIRRLQREAEEICRNIQLTWWDGNHIPVTAIPYSLADIPHEAKKLDGNER